VSSHADTIHAAVSGLRCEGADEYADAVDALLAENQQLRDALDETKVEIEALHRILRDAHAAVRVEER
jgi:hypothetical protein